MPPLVAAAAILAAGGLLQSIFAGTQKAKERKWTFQDWQKKRDIVSGSLKPEYSRYSPEKDYGTFDNVLKRLILSGLQENFGKNNNLGLDFTNLMASLGAPENPTYTKNPYLSGFPETLTPNMKGIGLSMGQGLDKKILEKYGMNQ